MCERGETGRASGEREEKEREGEKRRKKEKEGRRVRQCRAGGPAAGQKQRWRISDARSVVAALDAYSLLLLSQPPSSSRPCLIPFSTVCLNRNDNIDNDR